LSFSVGEMPHFRSLGVSFARAGDMPVTASEVAIGVPGVAPGALEELAGAAESGFLHAIAMSNAAITTRETVFFMDFITALRG
jgi:hypothetical protein